MTRRPLQRRVALALGISTLGAQAALAAAAGLSQDQALRFAADMAVQGNWREADYRWRQLAAVDASNANVTNNLAVAAEAVGRFDEALELYDKAVALTGSDARIVLNQTRARRLYEELRQDREDTPEADSPSPNTEHPHHAG